MQDQEVGGRREEVMGVVSSLRTNSREICEQVCTDVHTYVDTVEPLYRGHHWDPAGCPV